MMVGVDQARVCSAGHVRQRRSHSNCAGAGENGAPRQMMRAIGGTRATWRLVHRVSLPVVVCGHYTALHVILARGNVTCMVASAELDMP
jgi:hypothetical protein